jgi:hypothetical protein
MGAEKWTQLGCFCPHISAHIPVPCGVGGKGSVLSRPGLLPTQVGASAVSNGTKGRQARGCGLTIQRPLSLCRAGCPPARPGWPCHPSRRRPDLRLFAPKKLFFMSRQAIQMRSAELGAWNWGIRDGGCGMRDSGKNNIELWSRTGREGLFLPVKSGWKTRLRKPPQASASLETEKVFIFYGCGEFPGTREDVGWDARPHVGVALLSPALLRREEREPTPHVVAYRKTLGGGFNPSKIGLQKSFTPRGLEPRMTNLKIDLKAFLSIGNYGS